MLDGIPLICGGCIGEPGSSGCRGTDKCFKYDPIADNWIERGTMSGAKADHAYDYTASYGLAMAHTADPLEVTQDGINFELLADYPNPDVVSFDSGCLVILDDKNLFLAGGYTTDSQGSRRAYIYNKDNNSWREVGNMAEPREFHSCGIVPSASGTGYEVIVAGGRERESYEIFSIETETVDWLKAPLFIAIV